MRDRPLHPLALAGVWLAGLSLATACLVSLGCTVITWHKLCPDFMCYWAAGKILAAGQSPYDLELQAAVQREYGWDKDSDGLGFYDFLPYRNPPSVLGLACVLVASLDFPTARMTWLVLNAELLLVTGYMLRFAMTGAGRWMPFAVVPFFAFSILAVLVGQVTPLILFVVVAIWRLVEAHWDRSAGWILAWSTIKPQLTLVLLVAILLWSVRQRRWRIVEGFGAGLVLLLAVSTWIAPSWLTQLIQSSSSIPLVTDEHPWVGTTWILMLRSMGLSDGLVWLGYSALLLVSLLWTLKAAWNRTSLFAPILVQSLLAAFYVAPYARIYDLPILIIPLLILIEGQLHTVWASVLLFVFIVLPYVHFIYWIPPGDLFPQHVWLFWIPLLLTIVWIAQFKCRLVSSAGRLDQPGRLN